MPREDDEIGRRMEQARLFSLAAHELRTPVSVIGGYLRMLQRDETTPLTHPQRKLVDEATRSCARLTALVDELSEIGALDGGSASSPSENLDLFALVQEVSDGAREHSSDEPGIAVRGDASGASMSGDRTRLRAAFATFLRAVRRERPTAGEIIVDRRLDGGARQSAVIAIGTAAEIERAIDALHERLDDTRGGLGLALPIARRVIERHGGEVWSAATEPARPGHGAIVVSLPLKM